MWPSRFRSLTSVALLALAGAAGCSDGSGTCGPGMAPDTLSITAGADTITYGGLSGSPNQDCPDPTGPKSVVPLTIEGVQTGGTSRFTLCVPRPDKLAGGQPLGAAIPAIQVIDLGGMGTSCTYAIDLNTPPSGTAKATGLCSNGTSKAGFALTLDGTVSLTRTCGGVMDTISVALSGEVAVAGPP